jgi:hypothetical protein
MHRILIAYENSGVTVWSINKNRKLSFLNTEQRAKSNELLLAAEWFNER